METEENPPKCTLGNIDGSTCHYTGFHSHTAALKLVNQLNSEEQELLSRRSGLKFNEGSTICLHHEARLLKNFQLMQTSCYNPFGKKNHAPKKGLQPIDLPTADYLMKLTKKDVKPGQKLCPTCRKEMKNRKEETSGVPSPSSVSHADDEVVVREKMNSSLTAIGLSPVKIPRLTSKDSKGYAKRKLNQVQTTFAEQIASLSHLKSSDIMVASTSKQYENCSACDELIEELKQKLKLSSTSRQEKLQILTLVPANWSIKKTMEKFDVSERMAKKSRKLKLENGILSMPGKKQGRKLLDEVKQRILCFYDDDEFTRICPGKKDCLSVRTSEGRKVQMQKRLILCNLKELYTAYRVKNESDKVGFSKFCELRPKWCITVGAAGTHSVCVCTIHQNVKLMLAASHITEDYKSLISKIVCSLDSKNCMLHHCEECPETEELKNFLQTCFQENDPDDLIAYKQWVHTDRHTLETKQDTVEDFIEALVTKTLKLSSHHYVAKYQSHHLKFTKEKLKPGELVIFMDFAENYAFVVQDSVQGFHWENSQATLHPFVVYYKNADQVQSLSFCVISNCLQHDTIAVHVFLMNLIEYLKNTVKEITHIYYFSDGSAARFKNYKNVTNLCHHKIDFNCSAEWSFFGTSHGKSPCDGIGGTVKRLAGRASLQRPIKDQILTPMNLFDYCNHQINGIKFFFVSKQEIDAIRPSQEERFKDGRTVAGTRENHHFVPINEVQVRVSRVSNDAESSFVASLNPFATTSFSSLSVANLQPGQYIACIYDNNWWIGNICEISMEQHDALVNFMHPHGNAHSFYWPSRKDTCWIPEEHIIANIPAPTATAMGRQYSLEEAFKLDIDDKFQSIMK